MFFLPLIVPYDDGPRVIFSSRAITYSDRIKMKKNVFKRVIVISSTSAEIFLKTASRLENATRNSSENNRFTFNWVTRSKKCRKVWNYGLLPTFSGFKRFPRYSPITIIHQDYTGRIEKRPPQWTGKNVLPETIILKRTIRWKYPVEKLFIRLIANN